MAPRTSGIVGLRIGFGLVLAIQLVSMAAAYRIQEGLSQKSFELHRKHFQQQAHLTELSRLSWLAAVTARDLFLETGPDRLSSYLTRVEELRGSSVKVLDTLHQADAPSKSLAALRLEFEHLWDAVKRIPVTRLSAAERVRFLEQEIIPRRRATGALLAEIDKASQNSLYATEAAFGETRRSAAHTLLLLLGADALLAIAVALYSLRHSARLEREASRQFEEVLKAKGELERLSARLMEIQEQERTRIARELHDEIVQNLAVAKMEITRAAQLLDGKADAARLDRAREITDRTMKTVRNIMLLLRPSLLDDFGLGPALQWLAEDFQRRTGVSCTYTDERHDEDLGDVINTCVFRVVQEALHNAEKHASPSRVRIWLTQKDGWLTTEVSDDGCGFTSAAEPQTSNGHFGLLGMRERATAVRGHLLVESAPARGTTVTLKVPLPSQAAAPLKFMEKHA